MKKKVLTATLIIISSLIILLTYKKDNNVTFSDTSKNNNNLLSIMLETSSGSGNYQESLSNSFPTNGYIFNENLSNCENGSKISWNEENKSVSVKSNKADKCHLYFDIYEPTLAETIIKLYTGTQGENSIYYHDSNLTNGANDNSYRYAGANPNNYVCFGSDESTCPTDNLYRIIGVFDGRVKLIKADYATSALLGTDGDYKDIYSDDITTYKGNLANSEIVSYYWFYRGYLYASNNWSNGQLNKTNLNANYLNNIGSKWSNMIDIAIWKIGGNTNENIRIVIPSVAYQNEITNPASKSTYNAKIGLMYVSDYGFAAPQTAWTTTMYDYSDTTIKNANWLYLGLNEWTITPMTGDTTSIFYLYINGCIHSQNSADSRVVRPTFYLNNSVIKTSGDGTKTNPYRISN